MSSIKTRSQRALLVMVLAASNSPYVVLYAIVLCFEQTVITAVPLIRIIPPLYACRSKTAPPKFASANPDVVGGPWQKCF